MSTNFYDILGVKKTDSITDIKKAYKKLALKFHPDKVSDPTKKKESEELFTRISYAQEILSNEKTRAIYDAHGEQGIQKSRQQQPHHIKIQHQSIKIDCTVCELYKGCKKNIEYNKKILEGDFPSFSLRQDYRTSIMIDIPPRSLPGSQLIIENEGISHVHNDINGDLHVELNFNQSESSDFSEWSYSEKYLVYSLKLTLPEWLLGFLKNIVHPTGNTIPIYTYDILELNKDKIINPENIGGVAGSETIDTFLIKPVLMHPEPIDLTTRNTLASVFSYIQPTDRDGIDLNLSDEENPKSTNQAPTTNVFSHNFPHHVFPQNIFQGFPQVFQGNMPTFFNVQGHHMHEGQHMHGFQPGHQAQNVQQCNQQ